MNKVKMFFIAAAMLLTTAGVFAGKAKFAGSGPLFASNGIDTYQLTQTATWVDLSSSGTVQAKVIGTAGTVYGVYSNAAHTAPVFASGGF